MSSRGHAARLDRVDGLGRADRRGRQRQLAAQPLRRVQHRVQQQPYAHVLDAAALTRRPAVRLQRGLGLRQPGLEPAALALGRRLLRRRRGTQSLHLGAQLPRFGLAALHIALGAAQLPLQWLPASLRVDSSSSRPRSALGPRGRPSRGQLAARSRSSSRCASSPARSACARWASSPAAATSFTQSGRTQYVRHRRHIDGVRGRRRSARVQCLGSARAERSRSCSAIRSRKTASLSRAAAIALPRELGAAAAE